MVFSVIHLLPQVLALKKKITFDENQILQNSYISRDYSHYKMTFCLMK